VKFIPIGLPGRGLRCMPRAAWTLALAFGAVAMAQTPAPQVPQPIPAPAPAPAPIAPSPVITPPPPPKPKIPPDQKIENMWSGDVFYWLVTGPPLLRGGLSSTVPSQQFMDLTGQPHRPFGLDITVPAGRFDRFEFSGFQMSGAGTQTASENLLLYGTAIPVGDYLNTYYTTRNFKVSWNYLTYPAPPDTKFRFKTLWELQYTSVAPEVDAFYDVNLPQGKGTRSVLLPTLGVGIEYVHSARFRLEVRGSGFFIPHHGEIGDTQGSAVYRIGHIEIFLGGKLYHLKTSEHNTDYVIQNLWGPIGGLRFVVNTR
jgi:hypothetical protein